MTHWEIQQMINRYMLQVVIKNGQEYIYSPYSSVNEKDNGLIKENKKTLIDVIKRQSEINKKSSYLFELADLIGQFEEAEIAAAKERGDCFPAIDIEDEPKEVQALAKVIEEKRERPGDILRARIYKYIFDESLKMAKRYKDMYFTMLGDWYMSLVAYTYYPKDLEMMKKSFIREADAYRRFKHDEYPDV